MKIFRSVNSKILYSFFTISILSLALLWVFISFRLTGYLEKISEDRIKEFSKYAVEYLTADSILNNTEIDKIIREYSNLSGIRITLIDSAGRVIFDSEILRENIKTSENHLDREEISKAKKYRTGLAQRYSHTLQKDMIYYAEHFFKPMRFKNIADIYYIRTALPVIGISKLGTEIKFIIALGGIFSLMITLIISLTLSRAISKPLKILKELSLDLKQGIYKNRYHISGDDEISLISETLSELAKKIEDSRNEIKRMEKIKDDFIFSLSEELRTPLLIIENKLENINEKDFSSEEKIKDLILKFYRQTKQLHESIDRLILISHLKYDNEKIILKPVNLMDIITEIKDKYMQRIMEKRINFKITEDANKTFEINCEKRLLSFALGNLLENAIKFTKENGNIELIINDLHAEIQILIIDDGIGLKSSELKYITEYFYKDEEKESKGLGLALVKHIIKAHNGELIISSEKGRGSKFGFKIKK